MADLIPPNPNVGFTGFRYLLDALSKRQYALEFVDGVPKIPLHVFNPDKSSDALQTGETVFAFSDEQIKTAEGIKTVIYKITPKGKDEQGQQHYNISDVPVTYQRAYYEDASGRDYVFVMTEETKKILKSYKEAGFDYFSGIPQELPAPQVGTTIPMHHGSALAQLARDGVTAAPASFNRAAAAPYRENPNWKIRDSQLEAALKQYGVDLTQLARDGKLDPVIGRENETTQALKILSRRKQSSLCFTGDAGVGKTAMFYAIAQRIVDDEAKGELPQSLQGARTIMLDLQSANAGAKYRGDFEERVKPIIEGIAERNGTFRGKKLLLAIDEIHSQLTAGKAEGGTDAGNMMKPLMTTNGVSIMGATTDIEYKKYIEKDPALASRFEKMRIGSPDEKATLAILKGLWPLTKIHNNLTENLSDADFQYMVTMSNRYAPQESQPRKGEKVMNMAAASAEFAGRTRIERKDVIAAVAQMANLSESFLSMNDAERFLKLEKDLPKVVVGQPEILRVTDSLIGARSGLNDPDQPWATFLLQGPTGTGKTLLAKAIAEHLFGDEKALIKLDMADYQQEQDVSKITGAPPGYVGFEDTMPVTEQIRQRPYCVLLLDEIEKANPKVFDKFLGILNDGKITDNHGQTVLFNNVIIIMTSNLGAAEAQKLLEGKSGKIDIVNGATQTPEAQQKALRAIYSNAIKGQFRPEMLNRIEEGGGVIVFRPLDKGNVTEIANIELAKLAKRLSNADGQDLPNVKLQVSDDVMKEIIDKGYNPAMGARPLRKALKELIANPLGKWLMDPANKQKVEDFVAKEGSANLVIKSVTAVKDPENTAETRYQIEPELVKATPAPVQKAANDDAPKKRFARLVAGLTH